MIGEAVIRLDFICICGNSYLDTGDPSADARQRSIGGPVFL